MKIEIDIECTPDEARGFFGMPSMGPVHDEVQKRMTEYMKAMEPDELMKMWMPGGAEGMRRMQEAFFEQMGQFATGGGKGGKGSSSTQQGQGSGSKGSSSS